MPQSLAGAAPRSAQNRRLAADSPPTRGLASCRRPRLLPATGPLLRASDSPARLTVAAASRRSTAPVPRPLLGLLQVARSPAARALLFLPGRRLLLPPAPGHDTCRPLLQASRLQQRHCASRQVAGRPTRDTCCWLLLGCSCSSQSDRRQSSTPLLRFCFTQSTPNS
ncbi:hypothetical protein GUJ93_ZPchr0006g44996 [Zizania palustris]|uniref:Uncharacterized protein n=1 Tax=Zizania palustris TaxID=103762 RepID=A0A8J5TBG3_ZIZPA|nr:hypothetical protein GUJ93_ZPchr0006g44996 [Zizania palustris]